MTTAEVELVGAQSGKNWRDLGICAGGRDSAHAVAILEQVDHAAVSEVRNREVGQPLQRLLHLHGRVQLDPRTREELDLLLALLHLVVEPRIADRERATARDLHREGQVLGVEALIRLGDREADRAHHLATRPQRHDHRRMQPQGAQDLGVLGVAGDCVEELGVELADQARLARRQHLGEVAVDFEIRGVAALQVPRHRSLARVRVLDRDHPQLVVLQRVHDAPVAEARHDEPGQLAQRVLVVVDRRIERALHLREIRGAALELLRPQSLVALPAEQTLALLLGLAAGGDVTQVAGEHRRIAAGDSRDRDLDRELAAVATHPGQLEPAVEDSGLAGLDVAREPGLMVLAQLRRDDQLGKCLADHLVARIAEGVLRGAAEVVHPAQVVHRDHAVQRRIDHGALERSAPLRLRRRVPALYVLTERRPDARHRPQQRLVRPGRAAGEELDHALDAIRRHDRECGRRRTGPPLRRSRRARSPRRCARR